jgi:hypothetical protein
MTEEPILGLHRQELPECLLCGRWQGALCRTKKRCGDVYPQLRQARPLTALPSQEVIDFRQESVHTLRMLWNPASQSVLHCWPEPSQLLTTCDLCHCPLFLLNSFYAELADRSVSMTTLHFNMFLALGAEIFLVGSKLQKFRRLWHWSLHI